MGETLIIRNSADLFFSPRRKRCYSVTGLGSLILLALHIFDAAFKASSETALGDIAHFLQIEMFIYRCLQCIINH